MSDYGFIHADRVFTPNGTPAITLEENEARNQAIQAAELAHIATKPDVLLAYYSFPAESNESARRYRESFSPLLTGATVTTWLGAPIGTITDARVYLHNFGSRMVSLSVDVSGTRYYGRASYDWGQCVQLHKAKAKGGR